MIGHFKVTLITSDKCHSWFATRNNTKLVQQMEFLVTWISNQTFSSFSEQNSRVHISPYALVTGHSHAHTHVHAHTCAHTHTHVHTHTHTHTHTHVRITSLCLIHVIHVIYHGYCNIRSPCLCPTPGGPASIPASHI